MPLECTLCLIDNSDYSLNGDWKPDRLRSQINAVRSLADKKMNDNRESSVGAMVTANPRVMVSPTTDPSKFALGLKGFTADGDSDVIRSMKIAQMVLKNRPNRNAKQRIVLFIASHPTINEKEFEKSVKQLKKNNIAVDVVLLTDYELPSAGRSVLEQMDESYITVCDAGEPGTKFLESVIRRTSVYTGMPAPEVVEGDAAGGEDDPFAGIDQELDPDLFLAIQMSIRDEEERVRRAAEAASAQESTTKEPEADTPTEEDESGKASAPE